MGDGIEWTEVGVPCVWGAFALLGVVTAIFPSVYTMAALGVGRIGAAVWRIGEDVGRARRRRSR